MRWIRRLPEPRTILGVTLRFYRRTKDGRYELDPRFAGMRILRRVEEAARRRTQEIRVREQMEVAVAELLEGLDDCAVTAMVARGRPYVLRRIRDIAAQRGMLDLMRWCSDWLQSSGWAVRRARRLVRARRT